MQNWQEWRKEIREDRRESPVETFALLLVLAFLVGLCCGICFVGYLCYGKLFYFPMDLHPYGFQLRLWYLCYGMPMFVFISTFMSWILCENKWQQK